MLAYLARFSVDESPAMLGLDRYIRLAVLEGLLASVLLATHGLYDLERPQSWPVRLRGIVSSSSTALVLAVTVSLFPGRSGIFSPVASQRMGTLCRRTGGLAGFRPSCV